MKPLHIVLVTVALALCACTMVSTQVVPFDSAVTYPPSQNVQVLLQKPSRPHVEIAMLESRGASEAELFNDAREKAKALGADAIVKTGLEAFYHEPVPVYDPWYDPFYWGYYLYRPFPPYPAPWGPYRTVGGGYTYVLKALAIRFTDRPASP